MATSFFGNPNELLRNSHLVNGSVEIRTEPQKIRGRKPGSKKTGQQNQKKPKQRGMGVAKLEEQRIEQENKQIVSAVDTVNPNNGTLLLPAPDPIVVLQGFPSSLGGCRSSRIYCGGVGSGQIMIDPVRSPWSFVETSSTHHELSSIPNPQIFTNRCDTCFNKKKRLDGDCNVVRSNGGGFSKYTMIPSPPMMNGYDHLLQVPDQRSQSFFFDHRIARSVTPSSTNPYFNEATNHTGSMDVFGSYYMEGNPRNGSGSVKEYEFFPGKYDDFPGSYGKRVSVVATTSVVGDCSPNGSSTIDLSLKL
ncbi:Protein SPOROCYTELESS [Cardamine amara subsp. amara]|uniref:Protein SPOROCYTELESS n=1 Tax=Cardamine amara subsp. amara TaxID=228776 RepID=A0ABD1AW54_CARAN